MTQTEPSDQTLLVLPDPSRLYVPEDTLLTFGDPVAPQTVRPRLLPSAHLPVPAVVYPRRRDTPAPTSYGLFGRTFSSLQGHGESQHTTR